MTCLKLHITLFLSSSSDFSHSNGIEFSIDAKSPVEAFLLKSPVIRINNFKSSWGSWHIVLILMIRLLENTMQLKLPIWHGVFWDKILKNQAIKPLTIEAFLKSSSVSFSKKFRMTFSLSSNNHVIRQIFHQKLNFPAFCSVVKNPCTKNLCNRVQLIDRIGPISNFKIKWTVGY